MLGGEFVVRDEPGNNSEPKINSPRRSCRLHRHHGKRGPAIDDIRMADLPCLILQIVFIDICRGSLRGDAEKEELREDYIRCISHQYGRLCTEKRIFMFDNAFEQLSLRTAMLSAI